MLISHKNGSIHKGSEVFLSKKHIITQEQLSELCSEPKQSRSSKLIELVTKTRPKLNTVTKRSIQPQHFVSSTHKLEHPQTIKQTKLSSNKQNNKTAQQQQMNRLYQQNQKLGYRINYLNDQNNFYRISINNIEKLNNNIHKQLDARQIATGVKNKINTKTISTCNHHQVALNNPKAGHKLSFVNPNALSSHSMGLTLAGGLVSNLPANLSNYQYGNVFHPLKNDMARRSLSRVGSTYLQLLEAIGPINVNNPYQNYQHIVTNNQPEQGIKAGTGISQSFSQISNKIHLKNLQMKVGNSIRKSQKLKKIYEGSISSLTKKAQQLQSEINKLSREAEYYEIQTQLLNNIYKADYYMHLNQGWLQLAASRFVQVNPQHSLNNNRLDSLKQVSDQDNDQETNNYSDDDYAQYLKQDSHIISKLNRHKKTPPQHTITPNKSTSSHVKEDNNEFRLSKAVQPIISHNKNLLIKKTSAQSLSKPIRFMSGSYNHSHLGNTFKNSWYSALYNPKNYSNKLSQLMGIQSINNQTPENTHLKLIQTNKNDQNFQKNLSFFNHPPNNDQINTDTQSNDKGDEPKHMSEKELFLLPHDMINMIISSLEKEEIQQVNKLESLRKQEREQRKKNQELIEAIQNLAGQKEKLKAIIEQEFSLFFMNKVNTMQTISSFTNNQTLKKGTLSSNNNQLSSTKTAFTQSKAKSRTLYRNSSTFKLTQQTNQFSTPNQSTKPSPWISIQQRKQQADQLYMCSLYEKQLMQSIQKQEKLLQEQYKINQEYKQKIIDRNQQQNKELKVLEQEVNKCMEQVKEIKLKYKSICQAKGKYIGSNSSMALSANAKPVKNYVDGFYQQQA